MIHLKRTSGSTGGFALSKQRTPYPAPNTAPAASGTPYAAMGFIAQSSDGQLTMRYAPSIRTRHPRRQVPATA